MSGFLLELVTLLNRVVVLQLQLLVLVDFSACLDREALNPLEERTVNYQVIKYYCDDGPGADILSTRWQKLVFLCFYEYPGGRKNLHESWIYILVEGNELIKYFQRKQTHKLNFFC